MIDIFLINALNRLVSQQAWAGERLRRFPGAKIAILLGTHRFEFGIAAEGKFTGCQSERTVADVEILLPENASVLFFINRQQLFRSLRLSGPADLAESLGFVFRNLDWDIEGDLAALIGDIAARRVVRIGGAGVMQAGKALKRGAENISEYFASEANFIVSDDKFRPFKLAVKALEDELLLLERRVQKL